MKVRAALVFLLGLIVFAIASCSSDESGGGDGSKCENRNHVLCDGFCVDLQTDELSCGNCTTKCGPGIECVAGRCATPMDCPSGQAKCNGTTCVDVTSNPMNCGVCTNRCGTAQSCVSGKCSCAPGQTACGQECVVTATDVRNCGTCGNACKTGEACTGGMCQCQGNLTRCGADCVSTQSSGANCGMCGKACETGSVCDNGACAASCSGGKMQCGQDCVDFMTDPANCGACGTKCSAGGACVGGMCTCAGAGQLLCGGQCVDGQSDAANCGSCGNRCGTGAVCQGGMCMCPQGKMQCGTECVDVLSSTQHCGGCNRSCGTGTCSAGLCSGGGGGGAGGGGAGGAGGTGGSSGGGGAGGSSGCASPGVISDFESGLGDMVMQEGRNGWWYVFHDEMAGSISPPKMDTAFPASELPAAEQMMCSKYALHATTSGHPQYVGFGGTFLPAPPPSELKSAYDVSKYTGISFKIKSGGSGAAPPMFFEVLTKETQPPESGGTAMNDAVDMYNTRGRLITNITSSWQTIAVPFSMLAPRYLPDGTSSACGAGVVCEAPRFNPANALGFQFSLYDQFMTLGANGSYDLWVDDVKFVTGDEGLPAHTQTETGMFKFPRDGMVGSCTKPTGATGKQLIEMYQLWKKTFVVADGANLRVQRPEEANDTVSEGIAYGMLIAVYMNDKDLFDKLWGYWNAHRVSNDVLLMTWRIGGAGGSGAATDADEDTAFALLQAAKQWPGGDYLDRAKKLIGDIWAKEVSGTVLKPGDQFGNQDLFNPSYFAPAYYREFAKVDSNNWAGVISTGYSYINKIAGANGLVPAWCSNACSSAGGGGYEDANMYQYDSHRMPWRLGLDACWNDNAEAKAYLAKTTNFFAGKANNGIGTIVDVYDTSGNGKQGAAANSASIVGTAAIGAMVTAASNPGHKAFLDRGYQFVLDAAYVPDPTIRADAYTYYNATVGLLMALTMSGNFNIY
jgi:endo-1,4-beta-D-glucanase Y